MRRGRSGEGLPAQPRAVPLYGCRARVVGSAGPNGPPLRGSHLSLSALLWVADLERLRQDPELAFLFREEVGHDAVGYPPPTADNAVRRLRSTRGLLASCLPAVDPAVLSRSVEIPDLGTMTIAEWTPPILGHLTGHVEQAVEVLRSRGALPAEA